MSSSPSSCAITWRFQIFSKSVSAAMPCILEYRRDPSIPVTRRIPALALLALCATAAGSHAQTYPVRPVRIIVPYPAGGGTDLFVRVVAQKMSEDLGQQMV